MSAFASYLGCESSGSSDRSSSETSSSSSCDSTERINRAASRRATEKGNPIFYGTADVAPADIELYEIHTKLEVLEGRVDGVSPDRLPSLYEVSKPSRRPRRPIVPGASLSTGVSLEDLWRDCNFSEDIEFLVPTPDQRINEPPEGYFSCVESHFRDALLWFPIPSIVWRFLHRHKICLTQLPPGSIKHFVCILVRSYECDIHLSLRDLLKLLEVRKGKGEMSYRVHPGYGCRVLKKTNLRDHHWFKYFFFVRIDSSSVEGSLDLVRTHWGDKGTSITSPSSLLF